MPNPPSSLFREETSPLPNQPDASRIGWSLFIMALSVQVGGFLFLRLLRWWSPAWTQAEWYLPLVSILLPMALGYPPFFLLIRRIPSPGRTPDRGVPVQHFLLLLIAAFGFSYLTNLFTQLFASWFASRTGYVPENPLLDLENGLPAPALLFFTVIAAPVLEELVFRKLLLDRLRHWGEGFCILSTALLFALYHGNLSQFAYTFVVGLVFGYAAVRYSVRCSIGLHICLNLPSALILSFLDLEALEQIAASPDIYLSAPGEWLWLMIPSFFLSVFMLGTIAGSLVILVHFYKRLSLSRGGSGMPEGVKYRLFFGSTGVALFVSMHVLLIALSLFS